MSDTQTVSDTNATTAPRVRNKYHGDARPGAKYIGRGSPFGNAFIIGRHGDRDQVIAQHKRSLAGNSRLVAQARRDLAGRDLICFCAPKPCHGDFLLLVANCAEEDLPDILARALA